MNHYERIKAALNFEDVDRVPVNLWAHLPEVDQSPKLLAHKQVELARKFDFDFIKLMPFGLYSVEDYGAGVGYFAQKSHPAVLIEPGIKGYKDWNNIEPLSGTYGTYGKTLELAKYARDLAGDEFPIIQTIFNPLTVALKLSGSRIIMDIKEHPIEVKHALDAIVQTTKNFILENINAGVDGFFFATQTATENFFSREEYLEFGKPYDLRVIDAFKNETWFNVAHIHGSNTFFDIISEYPVQALNWHDRSISPSLKIARTLTNKAFIGGLQDLPNVDGSPSILSSGSLSDIRQHVKEAIEEVDGRGLIVSPGCVASQDIPESNIYEIRSSVSLAEKL